LSFVVIDNCIRCKLTDCVEVCPVDCFHEGPNMLAIDNDVCIDCSLCVAQCPIDAIKEASDLEPSEEHWLGLNASLSAKWPVLTHQKDPLPDWEKWDGQPNKRQLLEV